jgi:hypothetical protein
MNQTHNPHTRNPRISTSNPVHCQPYIFFEKVNLTCTDACIAKHKPAQISTGASPTYTHTLLIGTHCSKPKQCVHILPPFYHLSTRMKLAKALFYPKKIATWSLNSNYWAAVHGPCKSAARSHFSHNSGRRSSLCMWRCFYFLDIYRLFFFCFLALFAKDFHK